MQFIFDGEFYKVVRITGPQHNLLGISFSEFNADRDIKVIDLSKDDVSNVQADVVKQEVLNGVNEVNEDLQSKLFVKAIQYVSSDTYSPLVYENLAKMLVKRVAMKEEFTRV